MKKRSSKGVLIGLMICMILLAAGVFFLISNGKESQSQGIGQGDTLPAFTGEDLNGNFVTSEIFQENAFTLVNVWGNNCKACVEEMDAIQKIYEEGKQESIGVLGILADGRDGAAEALVVTKEAGYSYPTLIPEQALVDEFLSKQNVVPYTVLVDREGKIVDYHIGSATYEEFKEMLQKHLDETKQG